MTTFDRDKLRDELAKHLCAHWNADVRRWICGCDFAYPEGPCINAYNKAAHQADVALAWVETQMSEERRTVYDRSREASRYREERRLMTGWEPMEGGGK